MSDHRHVHNSICSFATLQLIKPHVCSVSIMPTGVKCHDITRWIKKMPSENTSADTSLAVPPRQDTAGEHGDVVDRSTPAILIDAATGNEHAILNNEAAGTDLGNTAGDPLIGDNGHGKKEHMTAEHVAIETVAEGAKDDTPVKGAESTCTIPPTEPFPGPTQVWGNDADQHGGADPDRHGGADEKKKPCDGLDSKRKEETT